MLGMRFPDRTPTAKKIADITECRQCVGPTFTACQQQTKMSVIWMVEPTDTNPNIASQGGGSLAAAHGWLVQANGGLVGWMVGTSKVLVGWLIGWFVGWMDGWCMQRGGWLVGWLVGLLV